MSVEVIPPQLGFPRPLTQLVKRTLTVSNPNSQPIAFKVKTTAPKQYCVRPNSGRIEPGEKVEVSVLLQPMKEDPEPGAKCRDKFLVQSTIITPERESRPFAELWSLVEKEEKTSISEHKIRCAYLPASEEPNNILDQPHHKSPNLNHSPLTLNNHTNRDEDDDYRYNSVKSNPTANFNGTLNSPPNRSDAELTDTTIYDLARDESSIGRQTRVSTIVPPSSTYPKSQSSTSPPAHLSTSYESRKRNTSTHSSLLARASSSSLNTRVAQTTPTFHDTGSQSDIQNVKAQLSAALAEIERLKLALRAQDDGIKRNGKLGNDASTVHSADMMNLVEHGLRGPDGLVPVQTVVLISIGVFAFTWLFF